MDRTRPAKFFQEEIDFLFNLFIADTTSKEIIEENRVILRNEIALRGYTDKEIHFLIGLATKKLNKFFKNSYYMIKPHVEGQVLKRVPHLNHYTDYKAYYGKFTDEPDILFELIDTIAKSAKEKPHPFPPVNPGILTSPEKAIAFKKVEEWMVIKHYFNEAGLPMKKLTRTRLAAILQALVELNVLKVEKKERPQIDEYFKARYKLFLLTSGTLLEVALEVISLEIGQASILS